MRARFIFAIVSSVAVFGCRGEVVGVEVVDAGSCMVPGNILANGDFASGLGGWAPYNTKTESIDGPCGGRGVRLFEAKGYGSIGTTINRKLKKGTQLRVRAYFRELPGTTTPPAISVRLMHLDDKGGEVSTQEIGTIALPNPGWVAVDAGGTLVRDEDSIGVLVASRSDAQDEFAVAAISVIVTE